MKKLISMLTALVMTSIFTMTVSANSGDFEIVTYDYINKSDEISMFQSTPSARSSEQVTPAYFPEETTAMEPFSIIGTDDRVKVSPNSYPYSAVMYLALGQDTTGNGVANAWGVGTGFMEGPDLLVTAAHCMWSGTYGWVEEMRVHYKQNGSSKNNNYYYPSNWSVPTEYTNNLNYNFDWAVVTLQTNLGDSSGWFGKGTTAGSLAGKAITVAGYPGDRLYYQYKASGTISSSDTYNCFYNADMKGGQSGGPVYDSSNVVWAINTYEGGSFNQGNRITSQLYNIMQQKYLEGIAKWH